MTMRLGFNLSRPWDKSSFDLSDGGARKARDSRSLRKSHKENNHEMSLEPSTTQGTWSRFKLFRFNSNTVDIGFPDSSIYSRSGDNSTLSQSSIMLSNEPPSETIMTHVHSLTSQKPNSRSNYVEFYNRMGDPQRSNVIRPSTITEFTPFWATCILESIFSSKKAQKELPAITEFTTWGKTEPVLYYPSDGGLPIKMRLMDFVQSFHSKCMEVIKPQKLVSNSEPQSLANMRLHGPWFAYHIVFLISFAIKKKWLTQQAVRLSIQFAHKLCLYKSQMEMYYKEVCSKPHMEFRLAKTAFDSIWISLQEIIVHLRTQEIAPTLDMHYAQSITDPASILNYIVVLTPSRAGLINSLGNIIRSFNTLTQSISGETVAQVEECARFLTDRSLPGDVTRLATRWFRLTSTGQVSPLYSEIEEILIKPRKEIVMKDILKVSSYLKLIISNIEGGLIPAPMRPIIQRLYENFRVVGTPNEQYVVYIMRLILRLSPGRLNICICLSSIARSIMSYPTVEELDAIGMARILPSFNADPVSMSKMGLKEITKINEYLDSWNCVWGWILTSSAFCFGL